MAMVVEENPIGEPADGPATEVVAESEVVGHSEEKQKERAPLLYEGGQR
jgi:hypothetical protein